MIPTAACFCFVAAALSAAFQSRNRETYDSNFLGAFLVLDAVYMFQSRNRETYDSNSMVRILGRCRLYIDSFNLVIEKLMIPTKVAGYTDK